MNENLSKLMKQAYNHPESRLSDDVWRSIELKNSRSLKIQSAIYSFIGVLSLGCFVLVFISAKNQFVSSGFFQYISLAFSDSSLLSVYWKEYLMSLTDSLPFASLGTLLFLSFSMLVSIKKVLQQKRSRLLVN